MFRSACAVLAVSTLLVATSAPAGAAVVPYGYQVAGTPATPATSGTGAALSPGLYRLTLPNDGSPRRIALKRSDFPNLLADVISDETEGTSPKTSRSHDLELKLIGKDDTTCTTDSQSLSANQAIDHLQAQVGYDATDGSTGIDRFTSWSICRESDTLTLEITHEVSDHAGSTSAELLLSAEPKATGGTGRAATASELTVLKPAKGTPQPEVTGGRGFTQAATVTDGTYPTNLTVGGWTFYRVRVGWGQRVAAELRVPADDSNFAPPAGVSVEMALFSPQRTDITSTGGPDVSTSATVFSNDSRQDALNVFSGPVRWTNRTPPSGATGEVDRNALMFTAVAGWYYIGVRTVLSDLSPDKPVGSVPKIPTNLAIQVTGTPGSAPTYEGAAEPTAGTMSIGKGVDQSSVPWVRISLSALVALLAAAAVLWALRQRRVE